VKAYFQQEDGTLVDPETGKLMFISSDRFVDDIAAGNCCFICGAKPGSAPFNLEHVLPDWLLRQFGLHSGSATLSNQTKFAYSRYKVPCCSSCNSLLGEKLENPVSKLVAQGRDAVMDDIDSNGPDLYFIWLALIFLKTHLKDRSFRSNPDLRKPEQMLSTLYSWSDLHHVHAIVRSIYTGSRIEPTVIGSMIVLPVEDADGVARFDFSDLTYAQTLMLRLGGLGFLVVFNDSRGAQSAIGNLLDRLIVPVTGVQLRELSARLAYGNLLINRRPVYRTIQDADGRLVITASIPDELQLERIEPERFGMLMNHLLRTGLPNRQIDGLDASEAEERILSGELTLLNLRPVAG